MTLSTVTRDGMVKQTIQEPSGVAAAWSLARTVAADARDQGIHGDSGTLRDVEIVDDVELVAEFQGLAARLKVTFRSTVCAGSNH